MGLFGFRKKKNAEVEVKEDTQIVENIKSYLSIIKTNENIEVCFYIDDDKVTSIGEQIEEINNEAYMNGYNWDIFFTYYFAEKYANLLEGLECDPEANLYVAAYNLTPENEIKAKECAEIICSCIENEELLYEYIREHGSEIEWD